MPVAKNGIVFNLSDEVGQNRTARVAVFERMDSRV